MATKRGQGAAGAAVLLAIIMGLIIGFIILIPPEERAKILGEEKTGTVSSGETVSAEKRITKEVLLQETPGTLSYISEREIEKVIPSVSVFTQTESKILIDKPSALVKKGVFSSQKEELYFELKDLTNTNKVLLDFSIDSFEGKLIITLNGQEIFNRETNKISPLTLPKNLLQQNNNLVFEVSSPGIAFWSSNEYYLRNIKVVADITDTSSQESRHLFYVNPDEVKSIEEISLKVSLTCIEMGKLTVKVNNYKVFSGVPQNCNDLLYYTIPSNVIENGSNWLSFSTEDGNYDIDNTLIKIKLKKPSYPTYYFDMEDDYFTSISGKEVCGEVDGVCPSGCDEDVDKDCCIAEYSTPYWCDVKTKNSGDRCVGSVDADECSRCPSGYEDKNGNIVEECKGLCGDDNDNYCPSNCDPKYDHDCCFEQSGEQFWCADLPSSGIDFTCLDSVSSGECEICPSSYEGEVTSPSCESKTEDLEEKLKTEYDIILTLEFADEENKEAEIYINGHKISFDTYKVEFTRNIDSYVEPWTNSIKIVPLNSFDVRNLKVELKS
ncbi:MAG: hypothetical protein ABIA37_00605 [Candidatus Woesearchaeota archaeon]